MPLIFFDSKQKGFRNSVFEKIKFNFQGLIYKIVK